MSGAELDLIEDETKPEGGEVEIDLESGEEVAAEPEAEKPEATEEDPGLEALRRQLEDFKSREAAERRKREAAEAAQRAEAANRIKAEKAALGSHHEAVTAKLEALDRDAEAAERAMAEAIRAQDPATIAKVQRIMVRIEAARAETERYRDQVVAAQDRPVVTEGPVRAQPTDPIEAAVANMTPDAANWVRAHSEIVTDPAKATLARRGHFKAIGEGIDPDTPEYFAFLDKHMGYVEADPEPAKPEPVVVQKKAVPAAPPASSGGNGGSKRVTLTRDEVDTARDLGMTLQEYARFKIAGG